MNDFTLVSAAQIKRFCRVLCSALGFERVNRLVDENDLGKLNDHVPRIEFNIGGVRVSFHKVPLSRNVGCNLTRLQLRCDSA